MDDAHGGFTSGSTDWRPQLESVVEILDLINQHNDALEVQEIIDRLARLEAESAVVTNDDFKFMERKHLQQKKLLFWRKKIIWARLEIVVIQPAGGSELGIRPSDIVLWHKIKTGNRIYTLSFEVDNFERGQWSVLITVVRPGPAGSNARAKVEYFSPEAGSFLFLKSLLKMNDDSSKAK